MQIRDAWYGVLLEMVNESFSFQSNEVESHFYYLDLPSRLTSLSGRPNPLRRDSAVPHTPPQGVYEFAANIHPNDA